MFYARIYRCFYDLSVYRFHMPSSNGSLIIVIKHKAEYTVHTAAMLFYTLLKSTLNLVPYF